MSFGLVVGGQFFLKRLLHFLQPSRRLHIQPVSAANISGV
ncbi:hypothetical protein SNOG_06080 [Parastagonospora nodorum SN15]|uniref:Uncharacterized protein n=1 Tax=Phaeosphaeria nodorum (strain SN15 / ATCC MYA-4574 / FGSC 10173) TaxID=321614 RepID=Q0UQ84_PHANO|nr:hypothetical protein SNOG_06080 [Parastagonospora nodorum SN15]EAT87144.1 hypothetical protein SNOG_06080 [Parastagonospora nodorum SN15]